MLAEQLAMVGRECDDRVAREARTLQRLQHAPDITLAAQPRDVRRRVARGTKGGRQLGVARPHQIPVTAWHSERMVQIGERADEAERRGAHLAVNPA